MKVRLNSDLLEATRLMSSGQLMEATALIQRALAGHPASTSAAAPAEKEAEPVIEGSWRVIDGSRSATERTAAEAAAHDLRETLAESFAAARSETLSRLRGLAPSEPVEAPPAADTAGSGARFITGSYSNQAGTRSYKLYIPGAYSGQPLPLVVMLHGCTQNPDDFAAGTRMNEYAELEPCLVLYPAQSSSANCSKCWNWFNPADQCADQGEPSLIAGMTREVAASYRVDPRRIYIAGLSAGGAMATIMAMTYADLYAAAGIHSGLPHAAAHDLTSALAAMQQGARAGGGNRRAPARPVPIIVFHGDRDTTVHPGNGDQVIVQFSPAASRPGSDAEVKVEQGQVPDGHAYTRTVYHHPSGLPHVEQWTIHGAGHAWSGGSTRGSYTDPRGPDASREMLRFFLAHPAE